MEKSQSEDVPILNGGKNPIDDMRKKREAQKAKLVSKMQKDQERFDCRMKIGAACFLSFVALCLYGIYYYYSSTYEERDYIDHQEATVHHRWKNYSSGELVDCSYIHPCRDWDCHTVKEYFRKLPHECKYDDWMEQINICLAILLVLAICVCCFG